ncbi:hypothetical protein [Tenacibaculum piscium]|uniref:hypothetical protein n=1 Tax=Tenacibaculum piscium TaxID=1458515 RepID=UPI001EFBB427|nr:hypothetical protein [Tenacibaculum piscium]MCG8183125.1 hypothetical protein [Tenacibaculum piscium]MCG8204691.1 hypothetical protein [Tenacibaculum piscium]
MTLQQKKSALIVILLLLTLGLTLFSLQKSSQYSDLQKVFHNEKTALEKELDQMIKDYTDVVGRKKHISKKLQTEIVKMKKLQEEIKNLKATNYNAIAKYKQKIIRLQQENKKLFLQVDSLHTENQLLIIKNKNTSDILAQKETINTSLSEKNDALKEKVALGSILKTSTINVVAMKERNSGKLTSTSRASRTDAFRINFDLLKNLVAEAGEKTVFIQIINQNNNVIAPKGILTLNNGNQIQYSDTIKVNYTNDTLSLVSLILVNRTDIIKGKYTISVFVDTAYAGTTTFNLR